MSRVAVTKTHNGHSEGQKLMKRSLLQFQTVVPQIYMYRTNALFLIQRQSSVETLELFGTAKSRT
jgi:hypothetical protein